MLPLALPSKPFRASLSPFVFLVLLLTLACASATKADTFQNGEFITYGQGQWSQPAGATIVEDNFSSLYGVLFQVGIVGSTGFSMTFTSANTLLAYLPSNGTPADLVANLVDPTSTSSGVFGGNVAALKLNVDLSNAGFLQGTSNIPFGNLVLQNFTTMSALNGLTISQFLADDNSCLGGGPCPYDISDMSEVTLFLGYSFGLGVVDSPCCTASGQILSPQTNLALPGSVTSTPEPSSLALLASGLLSLGLLRRRFLRA